MELNRRVRDLDNLTLDASLRQILMGIDAYEEQGNEIAASVSMVIAPIGILCNVVFLAVVVRVQSMRTIINVYLTNLSVADTLLLICAMVAASVSFDELPDSYAEILSTLAVLFRHVSYFLVAAIAVERFFAVRSPITFRARASKTQAAAISGLLWLLAVSISVIRLLGNNPSSGPDELHIYFLAFVLILYVVTFAVTMSLYIYIVWKLRRRTTLVQHCTRRDGQVVRMLIANTIVFFTLNIISIAHAICVIISLYGELSVTELIKMYLLSLDLQISATIASIINSSINPLVYSLTSGDYRAALVGVVREVLSCCCCYCRRLCRPNMGQPQEAEEMELGETRPREYAPE